MSDKVIELDLQSPTVVSVTGRLHRSAGDIEHISAVVTWKDGSYSVVGDTKDTAQWVLDATCLRISAETDLVSELIVSNIPDSE